MKIDFYDRVPGINYTKPTYIEFFQQSVTTLCDSWLLRESNWIEIQYQHTHFKLVYLISVLLCGIFWTFARRYAAKHIFKPIVVKSKLDPKLQIKLTELCFNMTVGTIAWFHTAYLTLYKYDLFNNPTKIMYEWDNSQIADYHQSIVFIYQIGFYIHRTYVSWFEDEWRRDSPVLMIHHIFTFILLSTGYIYRYYNGGIFVLFLHDLNDVLLSLSKSLNYLTNENGNNIWAYLSRITFAVFVYLWYLFRLHWFPLLLLHTSINLARKIYNDRFPPIYFINNTLLMFLLVMHFYWFKYILSAFWKILTNQKGPIKDDRDYEDTKKKE